jgi:predicted PurR-regulated permease PerM
MTPITRPNGFPPQAPAPLPTRLEPPPPPPLDDLSRRTVVVVLTTLLLLIVAYFVWRGGSVLLLAFAGVLFALFLSALSEGLTGRMRLPYHASLTIVVLALLAVTIGLFWLLASRLSLQIGALSEKLPQSLRHVQQYLSQYPWGRLLLEQVPTDAKVLPQLDTFSQLTGLISGVAGFVVAVIVIMFVGIFGAAEPEVYRDGLAHLVPPAYRKRLSDALDALAFNLRWWLVGQVFLMIVVGGTVAIGLWLIGVPEALTLGLMAGILELVPYIGPWIAAVPALLVALLVSPWHLMMTAVIYLGLHIVEAYFLAPLVQRKAILLPPALGIVAQILLGDLFGVVGLFIAAPLTLTVIVLVKMLYIEDTLGDAAVDVPGEPGNEEKPREVKEAVST